jgi:hypothetical protein
MVRARMNHAAVLLNDGRVLVTGGETAARTQLATTEMYDPEANTWTALDDMAIPRANHAMALLPSGKVLIMGGGKNAPIGQPSSLEVTATCELFDPSTLAFTSTGSMLDPRSHFQTVVLPTGKVMVMGGGASTHDHGATCSAIPDCGPLADGLASSEIYDEATGLWSSTAAMETARYSFSATLLKSGLVLVVAGVNHGPHSFNSVEIYDPTTGTWAAGTPLPGQDREHHSAALMGDGRVMVAGGKQADVTPLRRVDVYDPSTQQWSGAPALPNVRTMPGLVELSSGNLLTAGGYNQFDLAAVNTAAVFDQATNTWVDLPNLDTGRFASTLTLLANGDVLMAGGATEPSGNASRSALRTFYSVP